MSYEEEFKEWFSASLAQSMPASVKAFSFNLFELPESSEVKFGIELIGSSSFDENDPDWACDEVWEPRVRKISIPKSFSGSCWEQCLANVRALLLTCLSSEVAAEKLKSKLGVGLGFVDGDLEVLWQP
jgi:hypothetical protein